MKLAVLTGSLSRLAGGPFISVRRLAQVLSLKYGLNVNIYGLEDKYSGLDISAWEPLKTNLFSIIGPKSFGYAPGYYREVMEFQPDILQVHGISMHYSLVSLRLSRRQNIPIIIHPHGMLDKWALANAYLKKQIAWLLYEQSHLRHAFAFRALCNSEALSIRKLGLSNPICIIPNGIDLPSSKEYMSPPWEGLIPSGKKILLYLGRIHPKKGLLTLVKAWNKIHSERRGVNDWALVIAGWNQGGYLEELEDYASNNSLENSILFFGPLFGAEKHAALSNADAFILPSHSEGLPMTVLEAWANRLPVFMTPECNLSCGFDVGAALKISNDEKGVLDGLGTLLSMSDSDRMNMGVNGFTLVAEYFTWEKVASKMNDMYDWVLRGGALPECLWK